MNAVFPSSKCNCPLYYLNRQGDACVAPVNAIMVIVVVAEGSVPLPFPLNYTVRQLPNAHDTVQFVPRMPSVFEQPMSYVVVDVTRTYGGERESIELLVSDLLLDDDNDSGEFYEFD